jgi:hydrid cluster protein-associated redox disulfide domain
LRRGGNVRFAAQTEDYMNDITKDMTIYEVLQINPDIAPVFFEFGMHCLGCPISRGETVEQAAAAHGVDVEEMLKRLNEFNDAK